MDTSPPTVCTSTSVFMQGQGLWSSVVRVSHCILADKVPRLGLVAADNVRQTCIYLVCRVPHLHGTLSAGYLVCSVPCLQDTLSAVYLVCSVPCLQDTLSAGYLVCRIPCLQCTLSAGHWRFAVNKTTSTVQTSDNSNCDGTG